MYSDQSHRACAGASAGGYSEAAMARGHHERKKLLKKITHIEEVYEETEKSDYDVGRTASSAAHSAGGCHRGRGRRYRYPHHLRYGGYGGYGMGPGYDDYGYDYGYMPAPEYYGPVANTNNVIVAAPTVHSANVSGCSCADCARTRFY